MEHYDFFKASYPISEAARFFNENAEKLKEARKVAEKRKREMEDRK